MRKEKVLTMANKTIGQLTAKTTPSSADVFALEDTEDTKKINYDALADAILNKITSKNYTVAGSSQTLINAINTLNSKTTVETRTITTSYGKIYYIKQGSMVTVYGDLNITSSVADNGTITTGLPVPINQYVIGLLVGGSAWSRITIDSSGKLISSGQSITGYCKPILTYAAT